APRTSDGRSRVLVGMQAQFEHSPPISSRSTSRTLHPSPQSAYAACSPAGPAPRIATSKRSAIAATLFCRRPPDQMLVAAALQHRLALGPIVVDHREVGRVPGSAVADDHVLAQDALKPRSQREQCSP